MEVLPIIYLIELIVNTFFAAFSTLWGRFARTSKAMLNKAITYCTVFSPGYLIMITLASVLVGFACVIWIMIGHRKTAVVIVIQQNAEKMSYLLA